MYIHKDISMNITYMASTARRHAFIRSGLGVYKIRATCYAFCILATMVAQHTETIFIQFRVSAIVFKCTKIHGMRLKKKNDF